MKICKLLNLYISRKLRFCTNFTMITYRNIFMLQKYFQIEEGLGLKHCQQLLKILGTVYIYFFKLSICGKEPDNKQSNFIDTLDVRLLILHSCYNHSMLKIAHFCVNFCVNFQILAAEGLTFILCLMKGFCERMHNF